MAQSKADQQQQQRARDKTVSVTVPVPRFVRDNWRRAADLDQRSLANWMRNRLDTAAANELRDSEQHASLPPLEPHATAASR